MGKIGDRLNIFEFILSIIVFLIPYLLPLTHHELLDSISDYAYTEFNQYYVLLLSTGLILFIIDGIRYENNLNYLSAIFLLGVIIFPDEDFTQTHNLFAASFFLINAFNLIYYSTKREYLISSFIVILVLINFIICFFIEGYTLYIAETFALTLITGRYLFNKYRLKIKYKLFKKNESKILL